MEKSCRILDADIQHSVKPTPGVNINVACSADGTTRYAGLVFVVLVSQLRFVQPVITVMRPTQLGSGIVIDIVEGPRRRRLPPGTTDFRFPANFGVEFEAICVGDFPIKFAEIQILIERIANGTVVCLQTRG